MQERRDNQKSLGFDLDKATADANEFKTTWRNVATQVGDIAADLALTLMSALEEPFKKVQKFLDDYRPDIKAAIDEIGVSVHHLGIEFADWLATLDTPDGHKAFQESMHKLSVDIERIARHFHNFVEDLKWMNEQSDKALAFLNKWSGADTSATPQEMDNRAHVIRRITGTETPQEKAQNYDIVRDGVGGAVSKAWNWTKSWFGGGGDKTGDASPSATPPSSGGVSTKARWLVGQMQKDFGLTQEQAAGAVGWMLGETGGTLRPDIVRPGGTDTGWAQWVGARRDGLLALGRQPTDATNYAWMKYELEHGYKSVLPKLRAARTMQEALHIWGDAYEGAGGTPGGMEGNYRLHLPYGAKVLGWASAPVAADPAPAGPSSPGSNYARQMQDLRDAGREYRRARDFSNLSALSNNPWGSLTNMFSAPALGTPGGDTNNHVTHNQTNTFHIDGANDPSIVAHMVASNMKRTTMDISRNLAGATN